MTSGLFTLSGLLSPPLLESCHWTKEYQYLFVNHRWMGGKDTIAHMLDKVYRTVLSSQKRGGPASKHHASKGSQVSSHPCFVLQLSCPPEIYDVLCEPDKTKTVFSDPHAVKLCVKILILEMFEKYNRELLVAADNLCCTYSDRTNSGNGGFVSAQMKSDENVLYDSRDPLKDLSQNIPYTTRLYSVQNRDDVSTRTNDVLKYKSGHSKVPYTKSPEFSTAFLETPPEKKILNCVSAVGADQYLSQPLSLFSEFQYTSNSSMDRIVDEDSNISTSENRHVDRYQQHMDSSDSDSYSEYSYEMPILPSAVEYGMGVTVSRLPGIEEYVDQQLMGGDSVSCDEHSVGYSDDIDPDYLSQDPVEIVYRRVSASNSASHSPSPSLSPSPCPSLSASPSSYPSLSNFPSPRPSSSPYPSLSPYPSPPQSPYFQNARSRSLSNDNHDSYPEMKPRKPLNTPYTDFQSTLARMPTQEYGAQSVQFSESVIDQYAPYRDDSILLNFDDDFSGGSNHISIDMNGLNAMETPTTRGRDDTQRDLYQREFNDAFFDSTLNGKAAGIIEYEKHYNAALKSENCTLNVAPLFGMKRKRINESDSVPSYDIHTSSDSDFVSSDGRNALSKTTSDSSFINAHPNALTAMTLKKEMLLNCRVIGQVDLKYLLVVSEGVVLIIDQHAADERVKLENMLCSHEGKIADNSATNDFNSNANNDVKKSPTDNGGSTNNNENGDENGDENSINISNDNIVYEVNSAISNGMNGNTLTATYNGDADVDSVSNESSDTNAKHEVHSKSDISTEISAISPSNRRTVNKDDTASTFISTSQSASNVLRNIGITGILEVRHSLEIPSRDFYTLTNRPEVFKEWGFQFQFQFNQIVDSSVTKNAGSMNSVMLTQVPVFFGEPLHSGDFVEFVHFVSEHSKWSAPRSVLRPPALRRIAASKACRTAVKFGDFLDAPNCIEIVQRLSKTELPFQCAHGRPSVVPLLLLKQFYANGDNCVSINTNSVCRESVKSNKFNYSRYPNYSRILHLVGK